MSLATMFPPARVAPNAVHAFGGVWRLTWRRHFTPGHWMVLGGMLAVLATVAIAFSASGTRLEHYLDWASSFYVCFLVPVLSFIAAGGLVRDDLKPDSVDYVFTRAVRRPVFVAFRYLSHVACAQVDFLLALGVVTAVGLFRGVPGLWAAVPLLLLAQVAAIVAFSAFGFLCGALTSRYVIIGLVYGLIVEVGIGHVPTQLSRISMGRHVRGMLEPFIVGELATPSLGTASAVALLVGLATAMIALAGALLGMKELVAAPDRDA